MLACRVESRRKDFARVAGQFQDRGGKSTGAESLTRICQNTSFIASYFTYRRDDSAVLIFDRGCEGPALVEV